MSDQTPTSSGAEPVAAFLQENVNQAADALTSAAENVASAVEAGKRPGMPLDVLAKVTREAPLASLFVAFLLGIAIARQR